MSEIKHIGVMGAGSWGTALAYTAQEAGRDVTIWGRDANIITALNNGSGNPAYLPGIKLPRLPATTDITELGSADAILAIVPAQFTRSAFESAANHIKPGTPVILCSKGIERGSLKFMTDVLHETIPHSVAAVLSGPSFAADVARGLPTAITLACEEESLGTQLMHAIGRPYFRPYWSGDLIGAEIGGAVKNVLAIACGMVLGKGLGRSAHAATITRGFGEMRRLNAALGGRPETLGGLCGMGDLVLTCSSEMSRNMSFGMELGKGRSPQDILSERKAVTEGAATAPALMTLAGKHGVEMPICDAMARILASQISVDEAVESLLNRPFGAETG